MRDSGPTSARVRQLFRRPPFAEHRGNPVGELAAVFRPPCIPARPRRTASDRAFRSFRWQPDRRFGRCRNWVIEQVRVSRHFRFWTTKVSTPIKLGTVAKTLARRPCGRHSEPLAGVVVGSLKSACRNRKQGTGRPASTYAPRSRTTSTRAGILGHS